LVFGVLTLIWVFSGLFSMQPYGLLESEGPGREIALLRGGVIEGAEVAAVVDRLGGFTPPPGTVALAGQMLDGELQLVALDGAENKRRLDAHGLRPDPLTHKDLQRLTTVLAGDAPVEAGPLNEGDMFYYDHHVKVRLPAWKVVADDAERTHYYLDPDSGELLNKVDGAGKWYRWLHYGLHR